jgi:protein-tyrosine-phosphatase
MDRGHLGWLERRAVNEPHPARLQLLLTYAAGRPETGASLEISDPYFGAERDFDSCLSLIEAGCNGLLSELALDLGR